MYSLDLSTFMQRNQYSDPAREALKLVDYINALAPQLPTGFGADSHKTRYLRRAVMKYDWAQQTISQITTARHTFTQFLTALQERSQLRDEIARVRTSEVHYGQY